MADRVFIQRRSADVKIPGDVYVTGPHFGDDIYSSTKLVREASSFTAKEARQLIQTKWRGSAPHAVPVDEAKDLP